MTARARRPPPEAMPAGDTHAGVEGTLFVLSVFLTRIAVLAAIHRLVEGREFTGDVQMHLAMVQHPFYQFVGILPAYGQHPPLLGLLEAVFAAPLLRLFPVFIAMRLTYILFECLTAWVLWLALIGGAVMPERRRRVAAAFVLLPMGWMTTAVMAQDEAVAALFVAVALWAVSRRRLEAALLVCGMGVVCAKVFLLVPLLALVFVPSGRHIGRRVLVGFAPIVALYAVLWSGAAARGDALPLERFAPPVYFGANIWVFLIDRLRVSPYSARAWSSLLALSASMLPVTLFRRRRVAPDTEPVALLMAAMLLWVLSFFYLVNPEYYLLLLPALLLCLRSTGGWLLGVLLMTLPWGVNLFSGIARAMKSGDGSRGTFVVLYQRLFQIDADILFRIVLWASIVVTLWAAIVMTGKLIKQPFKTMT